MKENLGIATQWMLVHEGGYVNHPDDPGGATNFGVTQAVYNGFRRSIGKSPQSVRKIDQQEVLVIYKDQYWDRIWGDRMPHGLDYALYDFAVNSGPARAVKFIQRIVGVPDDGVMGMITYNAIMMKNDIESLISQLCINRWNWMKRLRTWKTFGRGWTRRVMGNIVEGVQADSPNADTGVIDRATWLFRENGDPTNISAPVWMNDGANVRPREEDTKHSVEIREGTNLDNVAKFVGGSVPGFITAMTGVPPGPLQWALAGAALIATSVFAFWAVKKLL